MAVKSSRTKKNLDIRDVGSMLTQQDELARWLQHLRENALLYAASAVFVVGCIAAGVLYRANQSAGQQQRLTAYARAMQEEDATARLAALERIPIGRDQWSAEVLYVLGETAARAGAYEKASQAFQRVCEEFGGSEFAPRAMEGLGFLAENNGDYKEALARYQEVSQKWPASFSARIQPFNIGRVQERLEDFQAAVAAYQSQIELFPGSHVARKAEGALERLRESHPELFPAAESAPAEEMLSEEHSEQDDGTELPEEAAATLTIDASGVTPDAHDAAVHDAAVSETVAEPAEIPDESQKPPAEAQSEKENLETTEALEKDASGDNPA